MNQTCKVCGEPAAGFHFGAFTCEGCKSFFGRSYNNLGSISECKNNGHCVINKKNRTACKSCRLKKCILVGMSKSGSRYGRRSNWFKIHCLLQEQHAHHHQQQQQPAGGGGGGGGNLQQHPSAALQQNGASPPGAHHQHALGFGMFAPAMMPIPKTKEELRLFGMDDCKHSMSPVSSTESLHSGDSSYREDVDRAANVRSESSSSAAAVPLIPSALPVPAPAFFPNLGLPPSAYGLIFPTGYPPLYHPALLQSMANNNLNGGTLLPPTTLNNNTLNNNNNGFMPNYNNASTSPNMEALSKKLYLDAMLKVQLDNEQRQQQSQISPQLLNEVNAMLANVATSRSASSESPIQDDPLDLSVKTGSDHESTSSPLSSDHDHHHHHHVMKHENRSEHCHLCNNHHGGETEDSDSDTGGGGRRRDRDTQQSKLHYKCINGLRRPLDLTRKLR